MTLEPAPMDKNYKVNGSYTYASPPLTTKPCWMAWCRPVINRNRRTVNFIYILLKPCNRVVKINAKHGLHTSRVTSMLLGCPGRAHRRRHSTLYGYSWMLPKLSRRLFLQNLADLLVVPDGLDCGVDREWSGWLTVPWRTSIRGVWIAFLG